MANAAQWVVFPSHRVSVLDEVFVQGPTRITLDTYIQELRRRLVPGEADRKSSNRGRKPGTGSYPTRESLLAVLQPIYEHVKKNNNDGIPTMQQVVDCNDYRDEHNNLVVLGISRQRLRTLRYRYGIAWPPL